MNTSTIRPLGGPAALTSATAPPAPDDEDSTTNSLLPEPASGVASIETLAALLTRADEQDRAAARNIEAAEDDAALRDADDRVHTLESKAGDDFAGAMATGLTDLVAGAATVGASFAPAAAPAGVDWKSALTGAGKQGAPAAGEIISGLYRGRADRADADAASLEARSQADERRYATARDDAQAADSSIQRVEQFLAQVEQTEAATKLTAASPRA